MVTEGKQEDKEGRGRTKEYINFEERFHTEAGGQLAEGKQTDE